MTLSQLDWARVTDPEHDDLSAAVPDSCDAVACPNTGICTLDKLLAYPHPSDTTRARTVRTR